MRGSWLSASTGTCVALVSCEPSTGQNPASSGYSRPQIGQAFIQTDTPSERARTGARSRRVRLAGTRYPRTVVQDAVAARALFELVFSRQLLEEHRRQAHVAGGAGTVRGRGDGRAATTAEQLIASVQDRRHVGDQAFANRFLLGHDGLALCEPTHGVAFD